MGKLNEGFCRGLILSYFNEIVVVKALKHKQHKKTK